MEDVLDSIAKSILEIIEREGPIKAKRIASVLKLDKKAINHYLYSDLRNICVQNDSYEWSVAPKWENTNTKNIIKSIEPIEQYNKNNNMYTSNDEFIITEYGDREIEENCIEDNFAEKQIQINRPRKKYRDDLERLCKYYLQCIFSENQEGIQVFAESKFETSYKELRDFPKNNVAYSEDINNFIQKIMTSPSVAGYFGYPVLVKVGKTGTKRLAPVFIWELDKNSGEIDISRMPEINIELIKHYVTRTNEAAEHAIIRLQKELGMHNEEHLVSIQMLANKLKILRKWQWLEDLDVDNLSKTPFAEINREGIYNKGVIISKSVSPFTKGLTTELKKISSIPLEECKGTALYDWIKGVNEEDQQMADRILEVLPLNMEQKRAVAKALCGKLTVVTGPPGTGKSQVVISTLINEVYNGKSVLFSSKNNKAVEVVIDRANGLTNTPFMAKLGGKVGDREFVELLTKLLTVSDEGINLDRFQDVARAMSESIEDFKSTEIKIKDTIESRNEINRIDKELEPLRDKYEWAFKGENLYDYSSEMNSWEDFRKSWQLTIKEEQPLIQRLRWNSLYCDRVKSAEKKYDEFKKNIANFDVKCPNAFSEIGHTEIEKISDELAIQFSLIDKINELKRRRKILRTSTSIDELQKKQIRTKNEYYDLAPEYWNLWLKQNNTALTANDKQTIVEYLNGVEILKGEADSDTVPPEVKKIFNKLQKKIPKYINAQAVTLLSANGRIPLEAGCFDLLVIDEASQCDIASVIPLLYRAKRVVVIGDLMQLPHVSILTRARDMQLLHSTGVEDLSWLYSVSPLFKLATSRVSSKGVVTLREHHRSHADIINFSNKEFYDGNLITATAYKRLVLPKKKEAGVSWIDVKGITKRPMKGSAINEEEAEAIYKKLIQYSEVDYKGGIGVISPFREQANLIRKKVESNRDVYNLLVRRNNLEINTVHQFQGDEKDIIFFSQTISNGATAGQVGFLKENGNLFNVAITRAKALLISVGDKTYCESCEVPYLQHFAKYVDKKTKEYELELEEYNLELNGHYPKVSNMDQVSDWEIFFYEKLYSNGIYTYPQYPVDKYKLDLAIVSGNHKLDIEVDGAAYHKTWDGELVLRDQLRNQRLFELGWDVRRFWVHDIRDNVDACISEIITWMEEHGLERSLN